MINILKDFFAIRRMTNMSECIVKLYTDCSYDEPFIFEKIKKSQLLDGIMPGMKVVIKPNLVQQSRDQDDDWDYVITHPVVISAVMGVVCDKLKHSGEIVIADGPMTSTRFDELLAHFPMNAWEQRCKKEHISFSIVDLRDEEWFNAPNGIILKASPLPGDPMGKLLYNLQDDASEFYNKNSGRQGYYGADYDIKETNDAHNGHDNKYSVSKTVLTADFLINIPKLKCHKKAGITCCLKNLVGINTNKNLLPHHTSGTAKQGGDQFSEDSFHRNIESGITINAKKIVHKFKFLTPLLVPLKNVALKVWGDNKKTSRSGGWYGNDTLWRTILDLNKILFYGNPDGSLRQDNYLNRMPYVGIVDGILAGDGNGPLAPDKVEAGFLLLGSNPVAIDYVAAKIMGFDYKKIPVLLHAANCKRYKIVDFTHDDVICEVNDGDGVIIDDIPKSVIRHFRAANGWIGHIETDNT